MDIYKPSEQAREVILNRLVDKYQIKFGRDRLVVVHDHMLGSFKKYGDAYNIIQMLKDSFGERSYFIPSTFPRVNPVKDSDKRTKLYEFSPNSLRSSIYVVGCYREACINNQIDFLINELGYPKEEVKVIEEATVGDRDFILINES